MPVDRTFLVETLRSLVRIDSRNPGLEPDAPGERELALFVSGLLEGWGWNVEVRMVAESRCNVVARRPGTGSGPSLMINTHLDTVGVTGMERPFSADLREGRVRGRGAQDTKGGMAAVLAMARSLSEDRVELGGDLVLAFVADEEHESLGTADLVRRVRTDAAIVIEPSDLDVVVAHGGFGIFRVVTRGRAAHGGRPDLGVDANLHMGRFLAELDGLRETWRTAPGHPSLGTASLHVPVLVGGRHRFVYADECGAEVECRTVPGQSRDGVRTELETLLERLRERVDDFEARLEPMLWRPPWSIDPERPIVRAIVAAAEDVRGGPARTIHHPWWEDSGLLGAAGIDAVVLGPRGGGLHTPDEWVDVDSVGQLAEILLRGVALFCGHRSTERGKKGSQHG